MHRNNSPILQHQSTPIKTIDLFPGSTTVVTEDVKPTVNSVPNFTFINGNYSSPFLISPLFRSINNIESRVLETVLWYI